MALAQCPVCRSSIQVPNVVNSQDSSCQYCRKPIWLYKCFSCMKVTAFAPGSKPPKCPHCFTMVRSGAPLPPSPPKPIVSVASGVRPIEMFDPGIAIDNLSKSIVDLGTFAAFIKEALAPLRTIEIGRAFLDHFNPDRAGVRGGTRYPNATVVFKPPTAEKVKKMPSVAETNKLTFFKPCDMSVFAGVLGQASVKYLTTKHLIENAQKAARKDNFAKFSEQLGSAPDTCLQVPANTEAASPSELLSNAGGVVKASPTGSSLPIIGKRSQFVNLLQSFEPADAIARVTDLQSGNKFPAQVTVFYPGSTWNGSQIAPNGDFVYHGTKFNLREVVFHELIHCYHYLIGSKELSPDSEDEKRAVGLFEYKNYKYSENVFRAHLKETLRLDYARLGVPPDPDLAGPKPKYDFLDPSRTVVDPVTLI